MENLKYTEILQANKALAGTINSKPYRISVLSNVIVNSFKDILEYFLRINKIEPKIELGNYNNIVQDTIALGDEDMVIIMYELLNVADSIGGYFEDINDNLFAEFKQKMHSELDLIFSSLSHVPSVIINTFSTAFFVPEYTQNSKIGLLARELNEYVLENKPSNFTIININQVILQIGLKASFDSRFYQSSKAPYSIHFLKNYCTALQFALLKNTGKLKKAIIFDCDNTLWKGVLGEDGENGINMAAQEKEGTQYNIIQKMAVMLAKKGVIIGLCSKNNPEDVDRIIDTHRDIVLKDEFIVIKKVNWNDKATNLRAIGSELNIGLESIVFVDDSSFEINLIKEQLPAVLTIQVPEKGYPELIQSVIYAYFNLNTTSEDVKKTAIYKEQFKRDTAKNRSTSIEEYLASLQMELIIEENNSSQISRVSQLTQKTNQFNLTTKRYTENQIDQFVTDKDFLVTTLSVKDKFGDNGLTGVCIVKKVEDKIATIDTLLMSCRIIGRNIEVAFLNDILHSLKVKGFTKVTAAFSSTEKNAQVKSFYETMNFKVENETTTEKKYSINLENLKDVAINYISIN